MINIFKQIVRQLTKLLDHLPHRCLPVLLTDSNSHMGFVKIGQYLQQVIDEAIGRCQPEIENANGILFREFLLQNHLYSSNKENISNQLNQIENISFNFIQTINGKYEKG